MSYQNIRVLPTTPHIGAEIHDIDLTQPLSPTVVKELHEALAEFQVIFFRNQPISLTDHEALATHFGEMHIHVGPATESKPIPENPAIRILHFDKTSKKVAGEEWHSDQTCAAVPPMGSILHIVQSAPNGGGATCFASMYAAYDALSPLMKSYLEGLTATHDGRRVFGPDAPVNSHPIIAQHPVTGRRLIFVNKAMTSHIDGLPRDESDAILTFLYAHCQKPEFHVRFQWQDHSIAFWDNRCTQHKAIWDYYPNVRSGYRIQIKGSSGPLMA
ncbi:TauD/TfdA dioxygenase family protein [Pseudomonas kuykendallii]|uniref:Taurine dioxygenase n=1 Tax=Pseudomonas kuykendallii TaxID=1007099 RepID=A0A2W5D838_9PSED|nr:TauD/TfdA family dioxygenase [Pseudomonas kuykendallii]PZP25854.1 MAG: taurine dioxygenase [Pseudomonas kuykendallii]